MKLKFFGLMLFPVVLAAVESAHSQTFNYNSGDVLVCFRNTASAVNDLVVDAGAISTFVNLPIGQHITITQFTGAQLAAVGTNSIAWSAFATDWAFSNNNDIWVTRPRTSFGAQTIPWTTSNASGQGTTGGKMDPVGADATDPIGDNELPAGANNTLTAIVEPESGNKKSGSGCYAFYVLSVQSPGTLSNFRDTFQGNVEQAIAGNFTTSGQNVRADFYQLLSTNTVGPGTYLGYFEFSTNGVMTYYSGPSPSGSVTTPVITSFTRVGTTNTLTFTTGSGGTYSLRGTSVITAPKTSWPVISSVSGNGSPQSLVDVNATGQEFYLISAQ